MSEIEVLVNVLKLHRRLFMLETYCMAPSILVANRDVFFKLILKV